MNDDRKFTDRQLALILKRAANLQAAGDDSRHSLEDIRQIAAQVGIPEELVTRAASEIVEGRGASGLLGPDTSFYATGTVPVRVDPATYPELASVMRGLVKHAGISSTVGGAFEWHGTGPRASVVVMVAPGSNETVVRVEGEYAPTRRAIYGSLGGASIGLALSVSLSSGNPLIAAGVTVGAGLLAWGIGRVIWEVIARQARASVSRVRDGVVEALTRGRSRPPPSA